MQFKKNKKAEQFIEIVLHKYILQMLQDILHTKEDTIIIVFTGEYNTALSQCDESSSVRLP